MPRSHRGVLKLAEFLRVVILWVVTDSFLCDTWNISLVLSVIAQSSRISFILSPIIQCSFSFVPTTWWKTIALTLSYLPAAAIDLWLLLSSRRSAYNHGRHPKLLDPVALWPIWSWNLDAIWPRQRCRWWRNIASVFRTRRFTALFVRLWQCFNARTVVVANHWARPCSKRKYKYRILVKS